MPLLFLSTSPEIHSSAEAIKRCISHKKRTIISKCLRDSHQGCMLSDCLESSSGNRIAITWSRRAARTLDASKLIKSVLGLGAFLTHFNYLNLLQGGTPFQGVLGTYWNQTADVRGPPGGDKNNNMSKCICIFTKRRTLT